MSGVQCSQWVIRSASVACAVGAFATLAAPIHAQSLVPADSATLHAWFARAAEFGFSGSVMVRHKGRTLVHGGFGYSDDAQRIRMQAESPMIIGSLAKPFTAVAVLRLVEQGKLSLADTIAKFLTGVPADKQRITVRQLLTHSSGLPYLGVDMFGNAERSVVLQRTLALPLAFAPGTRYDYSTPGYILLAGIVAAIAGEPFEQHLVKHIFAPAGMRSTGFIGESSRWEKQPSMVSISDGRSEPPLAQLGTMSGSIGGAGVVSTVSDLVRFFDGVMNGVLLSASSRGFVTDSVLPTSNGNSVSYVFNRVKTRQGTHALLHAGDLGGYNAELRWYPVEQLLVAVASNVRDGGIGYRVPVMSVIRRFVAGDSIPLPPPVEALNAGHRATVGTWHLPEGGTLRVWNERDALFAGASDAEGIRMLSASATTLDTTISARLASRAIQFLQAVARGDSGTVYPALHPSIPAELRSGFLREWGIPLGNASVAQDARNIVVIGHGSNEFTAYVATTPPVGVRITGIRFSGDLVASVQPPAEVAAVRKLQPSTGNTLTAFDIFTERALTIARDTASDRLAVTSPAGRAIAARMK